MGTQNELHKSRAVDYLLGRLDDDRAAAFEAVCFADAERAEVLESERDRLVDRYVFGDLGPGDRERFESHFLALPLNVRKLEFTRALVEAVAKTSIRGDGAEGHVARARGLLLRALGRLSIVAVAATLLVVTGYIAYRALLVASRRSTDPPVAIATGPAARSGSPTAGVPTASGHDATPRAPRPESRRPAARRGVPPSERTTIEIALESAERGDTRGVESNDRPVRLAASTRRVRFRTRTPDEGFASYYATLSRVGGLAIWSAPVDATEVAKRPDSIVVVVPTRELAAGRYVLRVVGANPGNESSNLVEYVLAVSRSSRR